MGGLDSPYHPTSKPSSSSFLNKTIKNTNKHNILTLISIVFLCSFFYLLAIWQGHDHGPATTTTCITTTFNNITGLGLLDFVAHHTVDHELSTSSPAQTHVYLPCNITYSEYTPCQDKRRSRKFTKDRLIYRERHCPKKWEVLKCRVPAPNGYKSPFKWPVSRDYVWYNNVPHKHLTVEKAVQNWIRFEGDRFRFFGGGTTFPNGADAYIDDIAKLINLNDGSIRTAIDTGCGVASWGAYLLSRNILTLSFAPKDTHEAQVQFALERGVPALLGVIPCPSRAFDIAYCSRCLIPWDQYDGVYLIEVDRVLRPGGYWILSGPPIRWKKYWKGWERTREELNAEQTRIESVAKSLCWNKVIEKGDIAIWQKPINHMNCKHNKKVNSMPHFFPASDPDRAWYTNLETCQIPLPEVSKDEEVGGGQLAKWPKRLTAVPPRISSGTIKGITPKMFQEDMELRNRKVSYYKTVNNQLGQHGRYRNLLDMNANLGGFAAALVDDTVWVMNVVPVEAKVNTLGVIYERGLIGYVIIQKGWGSYLLSRNILAMSFAPRDTHEAQVQFALERGVPALIGVMASKRLPYPSRAFDMAHCSRCLIPWDQYDGVYLIEVDRALQPGGYWILSGPPIGWKRSWKSWERSKEDLNAEQSRIENLAKNLCRKIVIEKDDIAIWQKPINHFNCRRTQTDNPNPPLCPIQDPDLAWYTDLQTCLTPLPEVSANQEVGGGQLAKWPKRLTAIPPRISGGSVNGVTPEMFQEDIKLWKRRMLYYKKVNYQLGQPGRYRNLLDMNAYFGGFAAALVDDPVWVMNVVPVEAKVNTLGVIYERGLIGTYQSWCEAMSTYPRTYDFIQADSIFTLYKDRCEMEDILLEMDRILRPKGSVIIRDDVDVLVKIKKITDALEWDSQVVNHEDGPLKREKLLFGIKTYWTAPNPTVQEPNTRS